MFSFFYLHRSSKSKKDDKMSPFQTAVTLDDNRDGEVIEVQILPQVSLMVK